ncbi:hypothetical protein [Fluviispira sanaruensis]|uniref:Uncharacterized protein n=1 Tax=Fluviispira sanaruensis TaxID=2493639 RepID=A0A4P2VN02_FLUSA|nr:hypothetical protein [Fluviispira sanaruensis]BBH52909.1 hypothetical protein JCM31447_13520 [Fluviispira sanaruensis]
MNILKRLAIFFIFFGYTQIAFSEGQSIRQYVETENTIFFDSTLAPAKDIVFYFPKTYLDFQAFYDDDIIPNPDPDLYIARVRTRTFIFRNLEELNKNWAGKILRPWNIFANDECQLVTRENITDTVQSIKMFNREISGASSAPICEYYFKAKGKSRKKILEEFIHPEKNGWLIKRNLILRLINERNEVKVIYL